MEVSLLDERVNNASGPRNATMTLRTPLAAWGGPPARTRSESTETIRGRCVTWAVFL
jgi:hypothetical protein